MKKFVEKYWPYITIFLLSFLITWPLFVPGYFSHHDDLQVMRIFEMRRCFADFQIPCRWSPDVGFGFGSPLFNFYGPFPYYLGAILSYFIGFIGAAKALFFLPLVFGGIGMYLLAKELFGKIPGLVASILYLFAPYRALDAYVRGAVGESFALALIPFVFYLFLKLKKENGRKYFVLATIFTFLFLVSHNIMTLLFTPLIILWVLKSKKAILSLLLAFGLASFFLLPAFFEKNLVQTEALTRAELNFRAQFVKVSQLFTDRSWNYSGSQPLSANTIAYQIGWPHWWLVGFAFFIFLVNKNRKSVILFAFLLLTFSLGVFMTHNKSAPIWEKINILVFVQFPWRFLSIVIFSGSLIGAYFTTFFKNNLQKNISILIVATTILLNWQYFKPEHFYKNVTSESKLTGTSFVDQQKGALLDYLPLTALEPRQLPDKIDNFIYKSNWWELKIKINKEAQVEVPVFYFPGWQVNYPSKIGTIGKIAIDLPIGEHIVIGKFKNTPIRTLGNTITFISFLSLVFIYAKSRKVFN